MTDAAIQKGTALMISYASFAYTGYVPDDGLTWGKPADEEKVTDENGATITKIIMDPRQEFSMDLFILSATGDITPPIHGATITINDPDGAELLCMCETASTRFARGATKLSMTLIKETSMTYA